MGLLRVRRGKIGGAIVKRPTPESAAYHLALNLPMFSRDNVTLVDVSVGSYQGGVSANITSMYDDQARHIAYIMGETPRRESLTVEPTAEAVDEWVKTMRSVAINRDQFLAECTPGYYNDEGRGKPRFAHIGEAYTPGIDPFNAIMQEWRDQGELEGMGLSK